MFETERVKEKFEALRPLLDERRLRLWAAAEARSLEHGGIKAVAEACGISRRSIERGLAELRVLNTPDRETAPLAANQARKPGGGRKTLLARNPDLPAKLERLVDSATRGDPMSPLRWTSKSTAKLASELSQGGCAISPRSVAQLLKKVGQHEDRNEQFEHINTSVKAFQLQGDPVISIDAKKKELVGNFANKGQEWQPKGRPEEVNVYDFIDKELGKVTLKPNDCSLRRMGLAAMGCGFGCGRKRFSHWPPAWTWRSMCATFRREPASGTKSNIGCSAKSPRTGEADP